MVTEYHQKLLDKYVKTKEYRKMGKKTMICLLTLHNGFEIIGTSSVVNKRDFRESIGEHFALRNALDKLDMHIAFMSHEKKS